MMKKIKRLIFYLNKINVNTIIFNFKYFPFRQALLFPAFVSKNTSLVNIKGKLILKKVKTGTIRIGYGNVQIFDKKYSRTVINIMGDVILEGNTYLGHGTKLYVAKNASLHIGENFQITAESSMMVNKMIKIGDNCLISWGCLLLDSDQHLIKVKNKIINQDQPIIIESDVWIGCRNTLLKGTLIKKNTIIGACSLLSNELQTGNSIFVGNPARLIKTGISSWE